MKPPKPVELLCSKCKKSPYPQGWVENLRVCWFCWRTEDPK